MNDQEIIDKINSDYENVVILKDGKCEKGKRGRQTFIMENCFGRLALDSNNNYYHSMLHGTSVKVYNEDELLNEIEKLKQNYTNLMESCKLLK